MAHLFTGNILLSRIILQARLTVDQLGQGLTFFSEHRMQTHSAACVAGSPQTALAVNHKAYYYPFLRIWKNVPSGRDLRGHLSKALILKTSRPRFRGL